MNMKNLAEEIERPTWADALIEKFEGIEKRVDEHPEAESNMKEYDK